MNDRIKFDHFASYIGKAGGNVIKSDNDCVVFTPEQLKKYNEEIASAAVEQLKKHLLDGRVSKKETEGWLSAITCIEFFYGIHRCNRRH